VFEAHRDHLTGVAYRMLGSRSDAEDAVQEAWLRWHAADQARVQDPKAWLTTVTARICLDELRSARVRREAYVGPWLPEPLVERLPAADADPADRAASTEQVSFALLVVLERLTPEQRVAFVLHDLFAVPFDEVGGVLGTSPAAARQHASRARRALAHGGARHTADLAEQQRVVNAFLAATRSGDLDGLLAVLAPDVVGIGDGGGVAPAGRRAVHGPSRVARLTLGLFGTYVRKAVWQRAEPMLVNGDLGFVVEVGLANGSVLRASVAFAIDGGRITGVFNQLNPAKLSRVPTLGPRDRSLPTPPA